MSKGEKNNKIRTFFKAIGCAKTNNSGDNSVSSKIEEGDNVNKSLVKCYLDNIKSISTQTRATPGKNKLVQTIISFKNPISTINIEHFKELFEKNVEIHKRGILVERKRAAIIRVAHIVSIRLNSSAHLAFYFFCINSKTKRPNLPNIKAGCNIIKSKLESQQRYVLHLLIKNSMVWLKNKIVLNTSINKFECRKKGRINPVLISFYILSNLVNSKRFYPFYKLLHFKKDQYSLSKSSQKEQVAKDIAHRAIKNLKNKSHDSDFRGTFNIVSQLEFFTKDRYVNFATTL
ncbi:hypothetical protein BEWA_007180 [Theileria equi strain WA]|uniref:Uncharacterized protein n=1 Tax=Theileria equi strain WA TaxID=1537102 RepID=L0B2G2_THEEQ|nr:hypothetical protein BEWA_007180 [Theileria equi strain WA]AFZ81309.1 hypothetical protein BEWA_007180 [Theileria equi strain WA]|eukprot:XP_004830975.1 hypothetical protein BEWA_007180 [Theileria equi strain WA]